MGKKDKRKNETEPQPEETTEKLFITDTEQVEIPKEDLLINGSTARCMKEGKRGRWCPWDRRGTCRYGDQCSYAHVKEDKKQEFLKGKTANQTELLCEYRIVLVDPQDSRNIGSVARLCANYGIDDIWMISGKQLTWEDRRIKRCKRAQDEGSEKAPATDDNPHHTLSTSFWRYSEMLATAEGVPILKSFRVVSELSEALKGVDRALAFTGKRGTAFRTSNVNVPQIPDMVKGGRVALVFGNEAKGLSSNDTLLCSGVSTLPTSSYCTSLNLAQSVVVVVSRLWELKHGTDAPDQGHDLTVQPPATDSEIAEFHEECRQNLESLGYPCSKSDWSGAGRRKNKFAYRCHKHVTSLLHVAQRSQATSEELASIKHLMKLMQKLPDTELEESDDENDEKEEE